MSHFLDNLITRSANPTAAVRPRPLSIYEPWPVADPAETMVESATPTPAPLWARSVDEAPARPALAPPVAPPAALPPSTSAHAAPAPSEFHRPTAAEARHPATPSGTTLPAAASTERSEPPRASRPIAPVPGVERIVTTASSSLTPPAAAPIERPEPIVAPPAAAPIVVPVATRPAPVRPVEAALRPLAIDLAAPPADPRPESIIQVTIGRIEVRATPPPARPAREPARAPVLGLDDYMRRRNGERP